MSELFDEFEFKPLTEGLGFHKKSQNKEDDFTPLSVNKGSKLSSPLPRKNQSDIAPLIPATTVDQILKSLNDKKLPEIKEPITQATPSQQYKSSYWDLSAFLLDLMLVLAINLSCLIVLLVTTKVDLFTNLFNPDPERWIYLSLLSLFAGSTWIYLVLNRLFLGYTPGEWVFDQRIGRPEETGSALYSLKIAARSTLVLVSGFIVFPILSFFAGKDILGQLTGTQLVKKS